MKVLALIPTPQHTVTAEILMRTGNQVIDINVYNESKIFRAVTVASHELDPTGRSLGRASNTFFLAENKGKEVLLFVTGTGTDRKIVRVDAEIEVLKRLLRTSMNEYPQGKFLFNLDKSRQFYQGWVWLYGLTDRKIKESAFAKTIADMLQNQPVASFAETLPILNRAIPPRIHKGLFFTASEVYWIDRPADLLVKITDHFYGEESTAATLEEVKEDVNLEANETIAVNITLPFRGDDKKWVAPRNPFDIAKQLLAAVDEHISIPPVTRIVTQNKFNHKTYGQYFIPGQGLFGKEMLPPEMVAQLCNRLADDHSILMRGPGFDLLYTKSDINALYLRQRGDTVFTCDIERPSESVEETSEEEVIEEPQDPGVDLAVEAKAAPLLAGENLEQILGAVDKGLPVEPAAESVSCIHESALLPAAEYENRQRQLLKEATMEVQTKEPENLSDFDTWLTEVLDTPVLSKAEVDLSVQRMAMNRQAIIELPAPYGNLLAWAEITNSPVAQSIGMYDNLLISFASATFYCKDGRIYICTTHVRLDVEVAAPEPAVPDVDVKEELTDVVRKALKEMSLAEILAVVSTAAL